MKFRAPLLVLAAIALVCIPRLPRDPADATPSAATPGSRAGASRPVASATSASPALPGQEAAIDRPVATSATGAEPSVGTPSASLFFGDTGPVALAEIPAGPFRDSLEALTPAERGLALARLARLRVPRSQVATLRATALGGLIHACPMPAAADLPDPAEAAAVSSLPEGAAVPIANPPALNSKQGATRVLYLDFNGHVVTGTAWNQFYGRPRYDAVPYDIDGNPATFSDAEQEIIREVWSRVAEDFAPFDINVTTVEPADFTTNRVGRVLITHRLDANGYVVPRGNNAGGVAYLGVFGDPDYNSTFSPAWVMVDNVGETSAANIAEVSSHEFGHNLGLSHDGTATSTYYEGHGNGDTSWAPIMGAGYGCNVTTFNPGDYVGANNPQDDLDTISSRVPYRADAVGDSIGSAGSIGAQGSVISGRIERSTDADVFRFSTASGVVSLQVTTFTAASDTRGNNLDLGVELLDSTGGLVSRHDAWDSPDVSINTLVAPGTYYLRLTADGTGDFGPPYSTGYGNYGSIGTYTITNNTSPTLPPSIYQQPVGAAVPTGSSHTFTIAADATATSYQWRLNGAPVAGATGSSLTLTNVGFNRAGAYTCVVSNGSASVVSRAAQLAVYRASGQTLTVNPTSNTAFPTLVAGAFDELSWTREGQTIHRDDDSRVIPSGATLRINGVVASDAGVYALEASFAGQPVAIGPVTLAVRPPSSSRPRNPSPCIAAPFPSSPSPPRIPTSPIATPASPPASASSPAACSSSAPSARIPAPTRSPSPAPISTATPAPPASSSSSWRAPCR